jgi:hypothetical protein
MSKKVDLAIITGESKNDSIVSFYCYKKAHTFSLPAFEVGDDEKFVLDEKRERVPLFEVDPEKGIKRRVRKQFSFALLPNVEKKTADGKTVEYKSVFVLHKSDFYFEDLYRYLTAESKKGESPVWNAEDFNAKEHPEAFKVAEKMSVLQDEYEKQIFELKAENERLKKGK